MEKITEYFNSCIRYIEPYIVFPDIIINVLDVLILTLIIFVILKFIAKTNAGKIIRAILLVLVFSWVSKLLGFETINWIMKNIMSIGVIAIIVLFQPEIRRALEKFANLTQSTKDHATAPSDASRIVNSIAEVASDMASKRWGALIVIERQTNLQENISSGIMIDAKVTEELLGNIFTHNAPLHDGAVIVRHDRIVAASCMLPLTQNRFLSSQLGMRHRAAIGITEATDALAVVVSEETGYISIAEDGTLFRNVDLQRLRERLLEVFTVDVPEKKSSRSERKGSQQNEPNDNK